jgi:hypothetical protein
LLSAGRPRASPSPASPSPISSVTSIGDGCGRLLKTSRCLLAHGPSEFERDGRRWWTPAPPFPRNGCMRCRKRPGGLPGRICSASCGARQTPTPRADSPRITTCPGSARPPTPLSYARLALAAWGDIGECAGRSERGASCACSPAAMCASCGRSASGSCATPQPPSPEDDGPYVDRPDQGRCLADALLRHAPSGCRTGIGPRKLPRRRPGGRGNTT